MRYLILTVVLIICFESCSGVTGPKEIVSCKVMYYMSDSGASNKAELYVGYSYYGSIEHKGMKLVSAVDGEEMVVTYGIYNMRVIRKNRVSDGLVWRIE